MYLQYEIPHRFGFRGEKENGACFDAPMVARKSENKIKTTI
jgi:hypothetical protein